MKPVFCILRTDGTNCDDETAHAVCLADGAAKLVHMNELRSRPNLLREFQGLIIPGGFSYGDDVKSGKIAAVEMLTFLREELGRFTEAKKPILGICNGFQILIRTGLLPFGELGAMRATLTANDSGHFECRWVALSVADSPCIFTMHGDTGHPYDLPVAHGEGKFFAEKDALDAIERMGLVVLRYAGESYPDNPNGSIGGIAGITDPSGTILGLMPHPERFVHHTQYPEWRSMKIDKAFGLHFFQNGVSYAAQL